MGYEHRGYIIKHDRDHYIVEAPDGSSWTEDTVRDAIRAIDEELDEE